MTAAVTEKMGRADVTSADAQEILARHGRSFHFASRFMGRSRAQDCARLYAFCRTIDDLADDTGDPRLAAAALGHIAVQIRSNQAVDVVVADFLDVARRHSLDLDAADSLIQGLTSDCSRVRVRDQGDLLRYAYRVAGTVGLLMAPILGCERGRGLPYAIDLGIAMQLTNIARDVREDAGMDRIYLPQDWIGDLTPEALLAPSEQVRADVADAVDRLLALADRYYASADRGLRYLPLSSRLAITIAARSYRAIGTKLRRRLPCWWDGRAVVGTIEKCRISVLEAVPRLFTVGAPPFHNPALHDALAGLHPLGG